MELSYALTHQDYLTCFLYQASQKKQEIRKRKMNRALFSMLYVVIAIYFFLNDNLQAGLFLIFLAFSYYFLYPKYEKARYRKHYAKHIDTNLKEILNQPVTLLLQPKGIRLEDEGSRAEFNWSKCSKMVELPTYFLVYFTEASTLILPKAIVADLPQLHAILRHKANDLQIPFIEDLDWNWKKAIIT